MRLSDRRHLHIAPNEPITYVFRRCITQWTALRCWRRWWKFKLAFGWILQSFKRYMVTYFNHYGNWSKVMLCLNFRLLDMKHIFLSESIYYTECINYTVTVMDCKVLLWSVGLLSIKKGAERRILWFILVINKGNR